MYTYNAKPMLQSLWSDSVLVGSQSSQSKEACHSPFSFPCPLLPLCYEVQAELRLPSGLE